MQKYKKLAGDKWIINTSKDNGSVRPIDLVSRNPDELREFDSKEAAVVFEEECYQEAAKLKAAGEDWSQYRYIPRKKLTIQAKPDAAMPELINDWNDTEVGEEPGNMMAQDARTQRMNRLKRENRYGENAAGKWVRSSAFREIDCDPSDPTHLREFDTFEEAFAFEEECRLNGTGGRKAVHLPKPKDTVPKEQLALAPKRKRKAEAEAVQPPMMKRLSHNHNPEVSDPELNNPELKNPELNNPVPPVLPVVKKEAQFEELQEKRKINDWNDTEAGEESEMEAVVKQEALLSVPPPRLLDEQPEIPKEDYDSYHV